MFQYYIRPFYRVTGSEVNKSLTQKTDYGIETEYSLRGNEFTGTVVSTKMQKSATVRWEHAKDVQKYERKERRNTKITSHVPEELGVKEGDKVRVVETRPISKTKSSMIVEIIESNGE